MKIFLDLGHPAHVHYFKNLIKKLNKKKHSFIITARNKDISHYLLNKYGLNYTSRGKGANSIIGKLVYMIKADFQLLKIALIEKPDLFLSFGSPYCAQVSSLVGKDHIVLDDTETATLGQFFYRPFSNSILSPSCFKNNFGSKHIKFSSYMELSYLHPNVFQPDEGVLKLLGVKKNEKFVILRFVGWNAAHDLGHKGISIKNKIKAVKNFEKYAKVFISSETDLPKELSAYKFNLPPEKMHDALAFAHLFYGESATMASESAVLGTPAFFFNNETLGTIKEQENKYGLVYNYSESESDQELSIQKGLEILKEPKDRWQERRRLLLAEKIDLTKYLIWFIENYPESKEKDFC